MRLNLNGMSKIKIFFTDPAKLRSFGFFGVLVFALLTSVSCSLESQLTSLFPTNDKSVVTGDLSFGKVDDLSGKVTSQSVQALCVDPQVQLKSLKPDGTIAASAIISRPVRLGKFELPLPDTLQGKIITDEQRVSFVLEVQGCGALYYRPVTGYQDQKITYGSTLLTMAGALDISGRKPLSSLPIGEVYKTIASIDLAQSSTLLDALNGLLNDSVKREQFETIVNVDPARLKEMPPNEFEIKTSSSFSEATTATFLSQIKHWNTDYAPAYEWLVDDVLVSTTKDFNFTLNKNSQGSHAVVARIGVSDGAGAIDGGKPVLSKTMTFTVSNDHPAVAPAMSLVGPLKRNVIAGTVKITTSLQLSACETFSSLALTEDALIPPLNPDAYAIKCNSEDEQIESFTLSSGDGSKALALWARDSAGNISNEPATVLGLVLDRTPPTGSVTVAGPLKGGASTSIQYNLSDALSGMASAELFIALDGTNYASLGTLPVNSSTYDWAVPSGDYASARFKLVAADQAGNQATFLSAPFVVDSTVPVLTQTTFVSGTYSATNSVTLGGQCEAGLSVVMSGAESATVLCTGGSWTFATNKTNDGSYNYSISQTDTVGNTASTSATWVRDTSGPLLTQVNVVSPVSTNTNSVVFGGACETGLTVQVSGAENSTMTCVSGGWSFATNKSTDGSYSYTFTETDSASNSTTVNVTWDRDSGAPSLTQSLFISGTRTNTNTVTFGGSCEVGIPVQVSGANSSSVVCNAGNWQYNVPAKNSDGTYAYTITQTDAAGNTSSVSVNWIRDTVAPILTQTSFTPSGKATANNTVSFSGACENGLDVIVSGADTASVSCVDLAWSFVSNKTTDNLYTYTFSQTDSAGNATSVVVDWKRDTTQPMLTQTLKLSGQYSNQNLQTIGGGCEDGLSISVSGADNQTLSCVGGAWEYTTSSKTIDGTYNYSLTQTDAAANSKVVPFSWTRDTVSPVISQGTFVSGGKVNTNSVIMGGSCEAGVAIVITGAENASASCSSGSWSFTTGAKLSDASYAYTFTQTDAAGNSSSVAASWVRDTVAPALTQSTFVSGTKT